ncbi:GntR family transcriptional regulator [Sinorhizobium meliloti]|uniref:GntR family transcriptional regulator n=1 Tax=Rhizobium meliloti TaxID=382 RepID=UPI00398D2F3C
MSSDFSALAERFLQTRDGLPDAIAKALREAVFSGMFAPNERLNQDVIAQHFGVSRVPVREALAKLVSEGLAVQRLNKGIRVAPLNKDDFLDIMELRALLEPQALRLSAPFLKERDYEEAEAILDRVRATEIVPEAASLHWNFHNRLYVHANRPRLIAQIESLQLAISRYFLPVWRTVGLSEEWDDSHRDIVTALRNGDADEAVRLTSDQIQHAMHRMLDQLPAQGSEAAAD